MAAGAAVPGTSETAAAAGAGAGASCAKAGAVQMSMEVKAIPATDLFTAFSPVGSKISADYTCFA